MKKQSVTLRVWKQSIIMLLTATVLQSCISIYSDGKKVDIKSEKQLAKREAALARKEAELAKREAQLEQRQGELLGKQYSSSPKIITSDKTVGSTITREYNVGAFRKISQNGVASIVFTQGQEYKVTASGDARMIEITTVSVNSDNTLVIDTRSNKKNKGQNMRGVTLYVTAPSLSYIKLDGVGNFTAEEKVVFTNDLSIDQSGVGSITLKNITASTLTVDHDGVGSTKITTSSPVVRYNHNGVGGSTLSVNSDDVKITLDGVGGVKVSGKTRKYFRRRNGIGNLNDKGLTVTGE